LDPLAQLSDIHLPAQIQNYPIAPGWWLIAILIIILFSGSIIKLRKSRQLKKFKKQALKQLHQNPNLPIQQVITLLKWTALRYFPRHYCANLYGEKFQQFLLQTLPVKQQATFSEQVKVTKENFEKIYQSNNESLTDQQVNQLAITWLKNALPPKKEVLAHIAQLNFTPQYEQVTNTNKEAS